MSGLSDNNSANSNSLAHTPTDQNPNPNPGTRTGTASTDTRKESEAAFVCTICWHEQYSPAKPKVLGESARIVCEVCWRNVLDLSICWRCGEVIVRGEEVVSLGWCFWHRGCFGCLVCGTQMSLVLEIGEEEMVGKTAGGVVNRVKRGVELESPPLCDWCRVEMEGKDEEEVVEKGLETVSRFDGGLSRMRREKLRGDKKERVSERPRVLVKAQQGSRSPLRLEQKAREFFARSSKRSVGRSGETEDRRGLLSDEYTKISEDGSADDGDEIPSDGEELHVESHDSGPSYSYISIMDPIGEPAFKPSKTKPLPKWMSLLPNNVHSVRKRSSNPSNVSCFEDFKDLFSQNLRHGGSSSEIIGQDGKRKRAITLPSAAVPHRKDNMAPKRRRESDYKTAEEYPPSHPTKNVMPAYLSQRPSEIRQRSISHNSPASYFCTIRLDTHSPDRCCALASHKPTTSTPVLDKIELDAVDSTAHAALLSTLATSSSEYLDRYQPKTSEGAKHEMYVAKEAEPVSEKIKREAISRQVNIDKDESSEYKIEKGALGRGQGSFNGEKAGDKRADVNRELKSLFAGED